MSTRHVRSFATPDEAVELDHLRTALVRVGGVSIARDSHLPGWRWSAHVKPIVKTDSCRFRHLVYAISGHLHVVLDDGSELDARGGEVVDIPPGHDAWVVGDEPFQSLTWSGGQDWLMPLGGQAERVLVTLILSDIVSSTDVARMVGDRNWSDLLGHAQAGSREIVIRFGGRVVDFAGDGVLAVFDGAARAVRCAEALRDAMGDLGLEVRSAVHTAEVERDAGAVRGIGVHEAARILSLAAPGEILVSDVTTALVRAVGLTLVDRGEHELRGIPGRRRLFALASAEAGT